MKLVGHVNGVRNPLCECNDKECGTHKGFSGCNREGFEYMFPISVERSDGGRFFCVPCLFFAQMAGEQWSFGWTDDDEAVKEAETAERG